MPIPPKDPIYEYRAVQKRTLYNTRQALKKGRYDLKLFTAQVKKDYVFEWVHDILIKTLQDFLFSKTIHQLMIFTPPRIGKSELSSCLLPSWATGLMAERVLRGGDVPFQIMQSSYDDTLADDFVSQQVIYNESPAYKNIFPRIRICPRGKTYGTQFNRSSTEYDMIADMASSRFDENRDGVYKRASTVRAFGIGGSVTGRGCHLLIMDDLIKGPREATSTRLKNEAWDWVNAALMTRLQHDYGLPGKVLILNTRWSKDDVPGRFLAKEPEKWKVLRFPAYAYDANSEHRVKEDIRKPGQILSQRRKYDIEKSKRLLSSSDFAALYQQTPVAEGGVLIKGENIQYWTDRPKNDDLDYILITADLAFKEGEENNFTVYQLWGYSHKEGNKYYLLDQMRDRINFTQQCDLLLDFAKRNPNCWGTYVEDDGGRSHAIFTTLKNKIWNFKLWPEKGDRKTGKIERVQACQHLFENKKVYYPELKKNPWVQTNIDEITDFPKGSFDDTVDATTMALIILKRITQVHASALLLAQKKPRGFQSPRRR